jgi:hypothetical protein
LIDLQLHEAALELATEKVLELLPEIQSLLQVKHLKWVQLLVTALEKLPVLALVFLLEQLEQDQQVGSDQQLAHLLLQ